jgi:signal transduction histidine kinase/DNA-binding NarL/FixJ family response regulator
LKIREATLNTDGIADIYMLIGKVYEKQGQLQEALRYELKGRSLVLETRNKGLLKKAYANLSSVYARLGNYKAAYDYVLLFGQLDDSIYSREKTNRLASLQMQYEFDKKAVADSIARSNENRIHQLNLQKQKIFTGAGIAGFILVALLLFFVYRNYTNQRKATAEMAIARERAERSEQFKQQFLANMSHEIRTPMNAVMGMTNLLIDKNPRSDQQAYLDGIRKSSGNLLYLLNDILDLAKVEAGKMELEAIDFSLRDLVDHVVQTMRFKAEEKGLVLTGIIHDSIPDVLIGDPVRLNQVLINLLGNAVKFTEKGSVEIRIEPVVEGDCRTIPDKFSRQDHSPVILKFLVIDTGIGIAEDKLDDVFREFSQANASDTRKFGGTGLGLAISKQLVNLMKGQLKVESEPGSGTTFSFELAFHCGSFEKLNLQKEARENIDGSILDGLSLLIADDNEYNLVVAADTLRLKSKVTITTASNGREVIDLLRKQRYDVILMDVQMPVMNGFEAAKLIRDQFPSPEKDTPIIALTASVLRTDLDRCLESGMNSWVPKPFTASQLIGGIAQVLGIQIRLVAADQITASGPSSEDPECVTDLGYLRKFCEDDPERMKKYIGMFLDSAPGFTEKLQIALNERDTGEIATQVHGYKTKWVMMGMSLAKDLSQEVEQKCREGVAIDEVRIKVEKLISLVEEAKIELKNAVVT